MFLHHGLDESEGVEGGVFEVPFAVHAAHRADRVRVPAFLREVGGFVFAAEEAAGYRVVDYDLSSHTSEKSDTRSLQ